MPSKVDKQLTGLAGELFVAAEMCKRGLQTSVTFGNAKAIDLLAYDPESKRSFAVQVKALRSGENYFPLDPAEIEPDCVYVFVVLNPPGESVEYFLVGGHVFVESPERFGKGFQHATYPGVHPRDLQDFRERWEIFSSSIGAGE